jgi:hypothetical protein
MKLMKTLMKFVAGLTFAMIAATTAAQAQPNPILYLTGLEYYTTPAGSFVRYRYDVFNKDQYPVAMFAPAPGLPPCGSNTNSSRSWVDFFNGNNNQRIYGFCALTNPSQLGSIWFALPEGQIPPSYVYIIIRDRQTNRNYRSNLADTTP